MEDPSIRIVKKDRNLEEAKKKGSWKIAYADFVTAMMAFFLVMWLISVTSEEDLQKMSSFFNMFNKVESQNVQTKQEQTDVQSKAVSSVNLKEIRLEEFLHKYKLDKKDEKKFRKVINNLRTSQELQKLMDNVFLDVTEQGLRIQIVDSISRPMFEPNTHKMQIYMKETLNILADILYDEGQYFSIAGHTRKEKSDGSKNDMWLLSFLRANQVRKYLITRQKFFQQNVLNVSGKADREPMNYDDPTNQANIRVEIVLLKPSSLSNIYNIVPNSF